MSGATLQLPMQGLRLQSPVRVLVVEGPRAGTDYAAQPPPLRIGSAPGNDIVIDEPSVSRHHVSIEATDAGLRLCDTGSTNGVFVGGHRVERAFVDDGMRVTLGQTVLELRLDEPEITRLTGEARVGDLVGRSPSMQAYLQTLGRVAPTRIPVLIEGETGTGKELSARALHQAGPAPQAPFLVVDCGAATPSLIESALFGHERGAFTGAETDRPGAFVAAGEGTIFLDEIGELPLDMQPKLLRALEAKTVTPLGAHAAVPFGARVVAATHRDLRRMVNEGQFREDLYFRLAVCPVRLPPLRERPEDVVALAQSFLHDALAMTLDPPDPLPDLDPETQLWLRTQPWPGNARQLRNAIQQTVVLGEPEAVARGALAAGLRRATHAGSTDTGRLGLEEAKRHFERAYLLDLLRRHGDDRAAAAQEADIHVKSLQRLIRRHDLKDAL